MARSTRLTAWPLTLTVGALLTVSCSNSVQEPSGAGSIATTLTVPTTVPTSTVPTTTMPTTTVTTTTVPTTTVPTTTVPTTTVPASTPYMVPLADASVAGWGPTHAGYPATDVFVACGAEVVSPVRGVAIDVRTVDSWDPAIDNPATRGGRSVAVLGDDGVRYYVAHLDEVDPALAIGERVTIAQRLGTVGRTGRTSACHLHVAISPRCPGTEWSVRRGVIWPSRYLDAWRVGEQLSPAPEVEQWLADHPTACADAMADPHAPDA